MKILKKPIFWIILSAVVIILIIWGTRRKPCNTGSGDWANFKCPTNFDNLFSKK